LASSCEAAAEISSVNKNRIKTNFMWKENENNKKN
jgi:hypothetical protein